MDAFQVSIKHEEKYIVENYFQKKIANCIKFVMQKSVTFVTFSTDIFVEINDYIMKPLEEYMLFTRSDSEKVEHWMSFSCNLYQILLTNLN